jgi:phage-related protein
VVFYRDGDKVPAHAWLKKRSPDEQDACYQRLESLRDYGRELAFPAAEHLQDGIWELRARVRKMRLRMLYFIHEGRVAVVTNAFQKDTRRVPVMEIERAKSRRLLWTQNPGFHTFQWAVDHE